MHSNNFLRINLLLFLMFLSVFSCTKQNPAVVDIEDGYKRIDFKNMSMSWKIEHDIITMKLGAKTTGWVAAGFDPQSKMKGADLYIGYVKGGKPYCFDHYGINRFFHKADDTLKAGGVRGANSILTVSGSEVDGYTTIVITRKLDTGDPLDKVLRSGKTVRLLLACGHDDDITARHAKREGFDIKL
jgi:hypothetical protein